MFLKIIMLFVLISCGTWAGNPDEPEDQSTTDLTSKVLLEFKGALGTSLIGNISVIGNNGATIGSITLQNARLSLRKIKIRPIDGEGSDEQVFKGPYIVDLLTETTNPTIETIDIPVGQYQDIKLSLAKLEKDEIGDLVSENDPLIKHSIYLQGFYNSNKGGSRNFEMTFDLDEEFFIPLSDTSKPMEIVADITNEVIVAFGLHQWFDFSGATIDLDQVTGTEIKLSKESDNVAKQLRQYIKEKIKKSAKFSKKEKKS